MITNKQEPTIKVGAGLQITPTKSVLDQNTGIIKRTFVGYWFLANLATATADGTFLHISPPAGKITRLKSLIWDWTVWDSTGNFLYDTDYPGKCRFWCAISTSNGGITLGEPFTSQSLLVATSAGFYNITLARAGQYNFDALQFSTDLDDLVVLMRAYHAIGNAASVTMQCVVQCEFPNI